MSTVNVQPTTSARAAVTYALLGTGARRAEHTKDGTTRAARFTCSMESPRVQSKSLLRLVVAMRCTRTRRTSHRRSST